VRSLKQQKKESNRNIQK